MSKPPKISDTSEQRNSGPDSKSKLSNTELQATDLGAAKGAGLQVAAAAPAAIASLTGYAEAASEPGKIQDKPPVAAGKKPVEQASEFILDTAAPENTTRDIPSDAIAQASIHVRADKVAFSGDIAAADADIALSSSDAKPVPNEFSEDHLMHSSTQVAKESKSDGATPHASEGKGVPEQAQDLDVRVSEDSGAGTVIAELPDVGRLGDQVTYQLSDANGELIQSDLFEIVGTQIVLSNGASLDFENAATHDVYVIATTLNGTSDPWRVTVTVDDVAEEIALANGGVSFTDAGIAETSITGGDGADTITAHADGGILFGGSGDDILSGDAGDDTLTGGSGDDTVDGGDGADVAVFSGAWADYTITEAGGLYTVADNRAGSPDGTDTVSGVEILRFADGDVSPADALNDGPSVNATNGTVSENAAGSVVGAVSATDPDEGDTVVLSVDDARFEIVDGQLKLKDGQSLDYEADGSRVAVTVTATDSHGATDTQVVTVSVADQAEAITLADGGASFTDAGVAETTITGGSGADTITAHDDGGVLDGGAGNDSLTGGSGSDTLSGGSGNDALDGGAGSDTAVFTGAWADYTITEVGGVYTVADNRSASPDGTDTVENVEVFRFTDGDVSPADALNDGPSVTATDGTITENDAGAVVGALSATDPDAGDTIVLSVDDARFEIVGNQIKLKDGESLDYEVDGPSVDVTVTATDAHGATDTHVVTVTVADQSEAITLGDGGESFTDTGVAETSIAGGAGGDTITAHDDGGVLDGGDGNDTLHGGAGDDSLEGGAGDDRLVSGDGDDTLDGGEGHDQIYFGDGANTVYGGEGNDYIDDAIGNPATTGGDYVDAGAGNDQVWSGDADDTVLGGEGADLLNAQSGNDIVDGGDGADTIYGEFGSDILTGGAGDDAIDGGGDTDVAVFTGAWADYSITGSGGVYTIVDNRPGSPDGTDTITNVETFRFLDGDVSAVDVLNDGPSVTATDGTITENDAGAVVGAVSATDPDAGDTVTLSVDDARFEILGGQLKLKDGESLDYEEGASLSLTVTATDIHGATDTQVVTVTVGDQAEVVSLADGGVSFTDTGVAETSITGGDGSDAIHGHADGADINAGHGHDTIIASDGDDTINAGAGDDSIVGGAGSDTIVGEHGNDTIEGGAGADHLSGNLGDDHIDGGDGSDVAHFDGAFSDYAIVYDSGGQTLTITDQNGSDGDQGTDTVTNVETFVFDGVTYTEADLIAEAGRQANTAPTEIMLTGGTVNETVADGGTIDVAYDPSGSTVGTLSTSDVDGSDTHSYSIVADISGLFEIVGNELRVKAGQTIDYESDTSFDLTVRTTDPHGGTHDEVLTILVQDYEGAHTVGTGGESVTGTSEEDRVTGGSGADTILAGDGDDSVHGAAGNDTISGGAGADSLSGGAGEDSLEGGTGNDTISGGAGRDTISGGAGDDLLLVDDDADTVVIEDGWGHDTVRASVSDATNELDMSSVTSDVDVTFDADVTGTAADGSNTLDFEGLRWVTTGSGDDTVDAAATSGWHEAYVGDGNDVVRGGGYGHYELGDGNDTFTAAGDGARWKQVQAGSGNDSVAAGAGDDALYGEEGDDTLEGGAGDDWIDGGSGTDTVVFSGNWADYTITESGGVYTVVDNRSGSPDGTDTITNVETFRFSDGEVSAADVLNDGPVLTAADGTVTENHSGAVVGSVSATDPNAGDTVTLSVDDARFEVVGGQLKLKDGERLDYEVDGTSVDVTVAATDAHGATDTQVVTITVADQAEAITLAGGGVSFTDTGVAETSITGGDGADTITAHDDGGNIDGGAGADSLIGGVGNDTLSGGSGYDTIDGGAGDDQIDLGTGGGQVFGGSGSDTLEGRDGSWVNVRFADGLGDGDVVNLNGAEGQIYLDGDDSVFGDAGAYIEVRYDGHGGSVSLDEGANIQNIAELYLDDGDYTVDLTGAGQGANVFVTHNSTGDITGSSHDDWIEGDNNGDHLRGGDGDDLLLGEEGDDTLEGGAGDDTINGDSWGTVHGGNDTAVFSGAWADYTITESGGTYTIVDNRPGSPDGTDTVENVEVFRFIDGDVAVADVLNVGPSVVGSDGTVTENDTGAVVGAVSASDPNASDTVTLSVDDARFEVVGGQLKLKDGESLDYEVDGTSVAVTVTATDAHGATDSQVVSVTVTDQAETITLTNGGVSFTDAGVAETTITGGDGADAIFAHADGGNIDGGAGDDNISGGAGDDVLSGGVGADTISGNDGDDIIDGGASSQVQGFRFEFYELDGTWINNLSDAGFVGAENSNEPAASGYVDSIDVSALAVAHGTNTDTFAVKLTTELTITTGGDYTFTMNSDDGTRLFIDGVELIDNDGRHAVVSQSGTSSLAPGTYEIEIVYFEQDGGETLGVTLNGPDTGDTPIDLSDSAVAVWEADHLLGGSGADTLTGGAGNDTVDGGDGTDVAVFSGAWADYTITEAGGVYTVADNRAGSPDGTDTVTGVEVLRFADGDVSPADALNDGPSVNATNGTVSENAAGSVVGAVSATDPDAGDTVVLSVDDARFEIVDGQLKLKDGQSLDYEVDGSRVAVTVTATDSHGATDTQVVTVSVADVNESGVGAITDSDGSANAVAENAAVGTVVGVTAFASDADGTDTVSYHLSDDAGGRFAIDASTGVVTVAGALDHEAVSAHTIEVTATSSDGSTSVQNVTIAVTDVDEAPEINSDGGGDTAVVSVAENTTAVTTLVADTDAGETLSYSIVGGADGALFSIDPSTGELRFVSAPDFEAAGDADGDNAYEVIVEASDGGQSDSQTITVTVGDANEGPRVAATDGTVSENAAGSVVGAVSATDPDAGDTVVLSVDDARFEIVDGQLKLKDGQSLDYESDGSSVAVTVTATDSHGATDTQVVTVSVADQAEAITLADGGASFTDAGVAETSITGGSGADTITAHDDGGALEGGAGNDSLTGGSGSDTLSGGAGNDAIEAGAGDDSVTGGAGDDTLVGGAGSDTAVFTGNLSDYDISASGGVFTITDLRSGSPDGSDTVSEIEIFDFNGTSYTLAEMSVVANGHAPSDMVVVGSDRVDFASGETVVAGEIIDTGAGNSIDHWAVTHNGGNLTIDVQAHGVDGSDLDSVIYLLRDNGDGTFTLVGSNDDGSTLGSDNSVSTLDSYLSMNLAAGDYVLAIGEYGFDSSEADDVSSVSAGHYETTAGGYEITFTGDATVEFATTPGDTTPWGNQSGEAHVFANTVATVESVVDVDAGDTHTYSLVDDASGVFAIDSETGAITVTSDPRGGGAYQGTVTMRATDANGNSYDQNLTISLGSESGDALSGVSGEDVMLGFGGDDTLSGGGGDDAIFGGDGNDTVAYSGDLSDFTISYNAATQTFVVTDGDTFDGLDEGQDSVSGVETLEFNGVGYAASDFYGESTLAADSMDHDDGSGGGYTATFTGGMGSGYGDLSSSTSDEVVYARGGNDTIVSGSGDDVVFGGSGNDQIRGNGGDDTIYGGTGNDWMHGGDGNDSFILSSMQGDDTVLGGSGGGWTDIVEIAGFTGDVTVDGNTIDADGWTMVLDEGSSVIAQNLDSLELSADAGGVIYFDEGGTVEFLEIERIGF